MPIGPRSHSFEINAMLQASQESEEQVTSFQSEHLGVKSGRISSGLHLTVYHGRRPLPGLEIVSYPKEVILETSETRFMVLAPGGENPRSDIDPRSQSVGIRVTKRNTAIDEIQRLRRSVYQFETSENVGSRSRTTTWTGCFGSRHFQPHIQLLRPWSRIQCDLFQVGRAFRSEIKEIRLDRFIVEERIRVDGEWSTPTS